MSNALRCVLPRAAGQARVQRNGGAAPRVLRAAHVGARRTPCFRPREGIRAESARRPGTGEPREVAARDPVAPPLNPRWRIAGTARGAHDAGESRVAIRGAGRAARGDQHALAIAEEQSSAGDAPALPLVVSMKEGVLSRGLGREPRGDCRFCRERRVGSSAVSRRGSRAPGCWRLTRRASLASGQGGRAGWGWRATLISLSPSSECEDQVSLEVAPVAHFLREPSSG